MPPKLNLIRELADTAEDKRFLAADGSCYKNLYELAGAMEIMAPDVFNIHVTAYKNDFSKWIRDVFLDYRLAEDIGNAGGPAEAARILRKRIVYLESRK